MKDIIPISEWRRRSIRERVLVGALWLAAAIAVLGYHVVKSYFEATAFNAATGGNVTTWDAMFLELRVQSEAKR